MAKKRTYTGQAPFGFSWEGDCLLPNESEALIRRKAFELFMKSPYKGQVARSLSEEGYVTRRGSKIRDVHVDRWLSCSSAIGEYAVNKTRKGVSLPPEEWTVISCEPIIEIPLWEAVQKLLREGTGGAPKKRITKPPKDPLTSLVYCLCGASMILERQKFSCRACGRCIPEVELEDILIEKIKKYVASRHDILENLIDTPETVLKAEDDLLRGQEELQEVEAKMSRIHDLYMTGSITVERFGELQDPLHKKREQLEARRPVLEKDLTKAREEHSGDKAPNPDLLGLIEDWRNLPKEIQEVILTELFEKVVVGDGEIEIIELLPATPSRTPTNQQTENPTNASKIAVSEPEWIRLPKPKERCQKTGLSRSYINQLILPNEKNGFKPPVRSKSVRRAGNSRGIRLVNLESLRSFLKDQET